jgi:hypothetical protein
MNRKNNKLKTLLISTACIGFAAHSGFASASVIGGVFETDRFGYTGTVTKYDSLADAEDNVNAVETIVIGSSDPSDNSEHRDASFGFYDNAGSYGSDLNLLMGSWWYGINGTAGNGNVNGNTGVGFMQLYDDNGSTDTSIDMSFSDFDGTYWTAFNLLVEGGNATSADDFARFSAYDNVHDAGTYSSYILDIKATGLQGIETGNVIQANNHATGVSGTFDALFSFGGDSQGDIYTGFYSISLDFDMENWAYSNNGSLNGPYQDGGNIYASQFVTISEVPEPSIIAFFALGMLGFASRRFKKSN